MASSDERTATAFRAWLSRQDINALADTLGIAGSVLVDTARAIRRGAINSLVREYEGLDRTLPMTVAVRPTRRALDTGLAFELREGESLSLARDYDNVLDRNATLVIATDAVVGFLPGNVAQLIAPEIDSGTAFAAVVAAGLDVESSRIQVLLDLADRISR
jgi:hypothetical protein